MGPGQHLKKSFGLRSCFDACLSCLVDFLQSRELRILACVCLEFKPCYVGIQVDTRIILNLVERPISQFPVWSFLTNAEACRLASVTFYILEWSQIQTRAIAQGRGLNLPTCIESDPELIAYYDLSTRFGY